jgi:hypothetical protein
MDPNECQRQCCPSPSDSVIVPNSKTAFKRKLLLWCVYGEAVNTIFKVVLFGMVNGLFNLISIWITYMGYATMHFCQVLIICFSAIMDLVMLAISWGALSEYLKVDYVLMIMFWLIFAFALVKFIIASLCYVSFKEAFNEQHQGQTFGSSMFGGPI